MTTITYDADRERYEADEADARNDARWLHEHSPEGQGMIYRTIIIQPYPLPFAELLKPDYRSELDRETKLALAAPALLAACKAALPPAWEAGSTVEDGVRTLLEDSRGDLFRALSAAIETAEGNPS